MNEYAEYFTENVAEYKEFDWGWTLDFQNKDPHRRPYHSVHAVFVNHGWDAKLYITGDFYSAIFGNQCADNKPDYFAGFLGSDYFAGKVEACKFYDAKKWQWSREGRMYMKIWGEAFKQAVKQLREQGYFKKEEKA